MAAVAWVCSGEALLKIMSCLAAVLSCLPLLSASAAEAELPAISVAAEVEAGLSRLWMDTGASDDVEVTARLGAVWAGHLRTVLSFNAADLNQSSDYRSRAAGLDVFYDFSAEHSAGIGYSYRRKHFPVVPLVSPAQVFEFENLSATYLYTPEAGSLKISLFHALNSSAGPTVTFAGEYRLAETGGGMQIYGTAGGYGQWGESRNGFYAGARGKLPSSFDIYASGERLPGNDIALNVTLVKSFGAGAGRVFRRN